MQIVSASVSISFKRNQIEVAFISFELTDRTATKCYQLWIIDDNNIKSLGMAHVKTVDGWVRTDLKDLSTKDKTFAISLEDGPDEKSKPTLPPEMAVEMSGE